MDKKVCTVCKEEKPATTEYFSIARDRKDGFQHTCKVCNAKYRKVHREKILQSNKQYYATHKEIMMQGNKLWQQSNKERVAARAKRYAEAHHGENAQRLKQWAINNPVKRAVNSQRRRALKRSLPCTLTPQQWQECQDYFNNKCCYCGKELPLTQEHFIPLAMGGGYTQNNIIPACLSCNSGKCDKAFSEWYPKQKFYSKKRENAIMKYLRNSHIGIQITMEGLCESAT